MFSKIYNHYKNEKIKKYWEKKLLANIKNHKLTYEVDEVSNPQLTKVGFDICCKIIKSQEIRHIKLHNTALTCDEYQKIINSGLQIQSLWISNPGDFINNFHLEQIITTTSISALSFSHVPGIIEAYDARQSLVNYLDDFCTKYPNIIKVIYSNSLANYIITTPHLQPQDPICILRLSQIGDGLNCNISAIDISKEDSRLLLNIQKQEKYYAAEKLAKTAKTHEFTPASEDILNMKEEVQFFLEASGDIADFNLDNFSFL